MPITAPLLLLLAAPSAPAAASTPSEVDKKEWIQLFDGKSLDGWTPKIAGYEIGVNYADTFRVENGVIKVSYDKYDGSFGNRFGHLFYKTPFSHYVIA